MSIALVAALKRRHTVRKIAAARARLAEMETNAAHIIRAQADHVAALEGRPLTVRDVARSIERREKAALLDARRAAA